MGLLSNIFGKKQPYTTKNPEHAVIVHFSLGQNRFESISGLEDELIKVISSAGVGEYDGNQIATDGRGGTLYMYGPDGDKLFSAVKPLLESNHITKGADVTVRYGPPKEGVKQIRIKLSS